MYEQETFYTGKIEVLDNIHTKCRMHYKTVQYMMAAAWITYVNKELMWW